MNTASKLVMFAGSILLLASCQEAYEQDDWVGEYTADLVEENGEPVCVDDVCNVLEMYQGCVDANPVQEVDMAVAAQVERQCSDDNGECCDMGFYISPEAASCISDNVGVARLMYHMGHGAPIWELSDGMISEVHAANGSVLSERSAPVVS